MAEPFIGEVKIVSFGFAMKGWALCNGQLLPINQNQALFSILGTTYGGNGQTTFALPDLRGRTPVHAAPNTIMPVQLGQAAGQENHTLITTEMPIHNHMVTASSATADGVDPTNSFLAQPVGDNMYGSGGPITPIGQAISVTGGSQPHNNMQPYLVLNFIIALVGIFPSRN